MADALELLTFRFGDAGAFPNNPRLPVLVYKNVAGPAVDAARDPSALAAWFEKTWPNHGWRAAWRYGIYEFPHYHSTAHQNLGASEDFHVVGGYPKDQDADLLRGRADERPAADQRIARVPLPKGDPLTGAHGALIRAWSRDDP